MAAQQSGAQGHGNQRGWLGVWQQGWGVQGHRSLTTPGRGTTGRDLAMAKKGGKGSKRGLRRTIRELIDQALRRQKSKKGRKDGKGKKGKH